MVKINPKKPSPNVIKKAASILKKGSIIIYPTDTCYGLGGEWQNKKVIEKISTIKQRKPGKNYSVIVKDIKTICSICNVDKFQKNYLKKHLPGPYTFILKLKNLNETLGVRIPKNVFTQKLANEFQKPYYTTSANISGQKECYDIDKIRIKPDLIIDAGKLPKNPPSKVIDLTKKPFKVLRN